jgi:GMP synthase (glutamine-hydrolysing)
VSRVVVLKTGTTLPELRARRGDYEDWIVAGMGLRLDEVDVVPVYEGAEPPPPDTPLGVVVTGSSAMVSEREAWSERAAGWLQAAVTAGTPVLGICYGHQLLAHALGGRVAPNPRGREIGTVAIASLADGDPLLGPLPDTSWLQVSHVESDLELPTGAQRLAQSAADPHQAYRVGERAWGVQFHPEFDADVIAAYLTARREIIREEGLDPEALQREVRESPEGPRLLARFRALLAG